MLLAYATTYPMQSKVDRMSIELQYYSVFQPRAIGVLVRTLSGTSALLGQGEQQVASHTEQLLQMKNGGPALFPVGLPRVKATTD